MPVITVLGIPEELRNTAELEELVLFQLKYAVASVPEMGVLPEQVTVFIPSDLLTKGLGDELIAFVDFFAKPERTSEVKQLVADAVQICLLKFALKNIPHCTFIEVFMRPLQKEEDGYSSWRKSVT